MSRQPFVIVCVDGYNSIEIARSVGALMGIPCVGRGIPPIPAAHALVAGEVSRLHEYLPGLIFAPSAASAVALGKRDFADFPWRAMYPQEISLFVTLTENINAEIKTGGTEVFRHMYNSRLLLNKNLVSVSGMIGGLGYRTRVIDDMRSHDAIVKKIMADIRLTRRNQLEVLQDRE